MNRAIVKDLAQYLPAQVVPALVGFFSIPVITHLFPPQDYGNYVLVVATASVFSILTGLFSTAVVRFYPGCEARHTLPEFYATTLGVTVLLLGAFTLLLAGVLALAGPHLPQGLSSLRVVGLLFCVGQSVFMIYPEFFRARRRIASYGGLMAWRSVAGIGLGLLLVLGLGLGIEGLLWGTILSILVVLGVTWKGALGDVRFRPRHFSWRLGREMAAFGLPLVVGNLFSRIIYLSDRYILGISRSGQEVGIYSANYDLADRTIMLIATLFALTSGSIAFHVWEKEGEEESRKFATNLTRYYLMIGLPAVVGLSVLARPLIRLMTGPEYHQGSRIIPVVVLGAFFFGLQQRYQIGLLFTKNTRRIMVSVMVAGVCNLILNLLLIPRHGYLAAAWVALVSQLLLLGLMVFHSRRCFAWEFPAGSLLRILVASAVMGAVLLALARARPEPGVGGVVARVGIGFVVYASALLGVREIRESEIAAIRRVLPWTTRP